MASHQIHQHSRFSVEFAIGVGEEWAQNHDQFHWLGDGVPRELTSCRDAAQDQEVAHRHEP